MKSRFSLPAAAFAMAFSLAAGAATLPSPQTLDGITYLTGGIGREEAGAMRAEAKNYPLSLVFSAGPRRAFVSDVKVTIKDKSGKVVLDSASGGPIMLVQLPAGQYTVSAVQGSIALHRNVQVSAHGGKQLSLYWPNA